MKDLIIINNEKVFEENKNFYCDNLDLKILPEDLNNYYKVQYIVRSSNKKKIKKLIWTMLSHHLIFLNLFILFIKL